MASLDPVPKLTHNDSSTDNSQQDIRVLNNAKITKNKNTNISISISNIGRRFREMPFWVQAIALVILLMAAYLAYRHFIEGSQRVARLVSIVERDIDSAKSDFMSASNNFISVIPNNILQDNTPRNWAAVSRIWMRSGTTIDRAYAAAVQCLKSGECQIGSQASGVCQQAVMLADADLESFRRLDDITGIHVNSSGGSSILPTPTGVGEVEVPEMTNLYFFARECITS